MRESELQASIFSFLRKEKSQGVKLHFERREAGGFIYSKGLPDFWMTINGKHYEIELKRPGGQPSALQVVWKQRFDEICTHIFCESLEEFKSYYERWKNDE